jgi:methylenetetrahydrofolate reductase (NADPH)
MVNVKQLQSLVGNFSIETTPATAVRVESFKALLPAGTKVNVTFLPGTDYLDTVATAARLRNEGWYPSRTSARAALPTPLPLKLI